MEVGAGQVQRELKQWEGWFEGSSKADGQSAEPDLGLLRLGETPCPWGTIILLGWTLEAGMESLVHDVSHS